MMYINKRKTIVTSKFFFLLPVVHKILAPSYVRQHNKMLVVKTFLFFHTIIDTTAYHFNMI